MKVAWSLAALAQLRAAHRYLSKENPRAASEFLAALEALEENLSHFPKMGVRTKQPGVMAFPLVRYRYRLFYKIERDEIRIIRIRHTSRRPLE